MPTEWGYLSTQLVFTSVHSEHEVSLYSGKIVWCLQRCLTGSGCDCRHRQVLSVTAHSHLWFQLQENMKPVLSVSAKPVKYGRYVFSSEGWGVGGRGEGNLTITNAAGGATALCGDSWFILNGAGSVFKDTSEAMLVTLQTTVIFFGFLLG